MLNNNDNSYNTYMFNDDIILVMIVYINLIQLYLRLIKTSIIIINVPINAYDLISLYTIEDAFSYFTLRYVMLRYMILVPNNTDAKCI